MDGKIGRFTGDELLEKGGGQEAELSPEHSGRESLEERGRQPSCSTEKYRTPPE